MTREMGKVLAETRGDVQEAIDEAFYVAGEGRRLFGVTTPSELPEQVRHERPHAGRRGRPHHPVELPHGHSQLEALSRSRRRQHLRHQARHRHAALHLQPRPGARRCRPAAGRGQHRLRHRLGRGQRRWSSIPTCAPSASPAPAPWARSSPSAPPPPSSRFRSRWAAKTRRSSSTTPTSISPSTARSGAHSAPPASAARPPAASCCRKGIAAEFTDKFVARAKKLKVGNGLDESVEVGPQVNASQIETSSEVCRDRASAKERSSSAAATR